MNRLRWPKRIAWPIYLLSMSMIVWLLLFGYILRQNHAHQEELAAAVAERDNDVNRFLRAEVCDRLRLRDEIQISYLRAAANKNRPTDPLYADVLEDAATAIEFTKEGCLTELPE